MNKDRTEFGRIDCACCGTAQGVRITLDRNGEPFGYCDADCSMQYRFGGNAHKVRRFNANHPEIAEAIAASKRGGEPASAPAAPAPAPAAKAATTTTPAPAPASKKTPGRSPMADALEFLGMKA